MATTAAAATIVIEVHEYAPGGGPLRLPLVGPTVSAGFPSPAGDYVETRLDLNEHLIRHPAATFFVRVRGDSMTGAGVHDGDLLVVDRAEDARDGSVVVASVAGELLVKRLRHRPAGTFLEAEHPGYPPVPVGEDNPAEVWGVVVAVIHRP